MENDGSSHLDSKTLLILYLLLSLVITNMEGKGLEMNHIHNGKKSTTVLIFFKLSCYLKHDQGHLNRFFFFNARLTKTSIVKLFQRSHLKSNRNITDVKVIARAGNASFPLKQTQSITFVVISIDVTAIKSLNNDLVG